MSTSTRYPTTNAAGSTGFTNAGNAYASDDSYATAAPGTNSTISSYFGGFDFASYIPSGATINSVTVYCERKFSTTASTASSTLRPYNLTTALAAEDENTAEPTSDTVYSVNFGALGVTDVRSADFRILVGAKRGTGATGYTYSLDVVYVTVDYTATAAYSLTCDYATFTLTGQDVTFKRGYALACSQATLSLTGQDAGLLRAEKLTCTYGLIYLAKQDCILTYTTVGASLTCETASFTLAGQDVTFTSTITLACDQASFTITGQDASLARGYVLAAVYASYTLSGQEIAFLQAIKLACETVSLMLTGQDVTLTYLQPGEYTLEAAYATYTLTGQDLSFVAGTSLLCVYAVFTLSGQSAQLFYGLWEPTGDMITLGTLLTRIQSALGDTSSAIWDRVEVIWPFAVDAIRDFPILRPKSSVYTVTEAGHSFSLPSDFRKVIYVEYPPYQDPPEYLRRKPHLGAGFFGEDGFYDVDRDYDIGEDYILWVSNDLAVSDVVIVRYLATHTTEFANEYSYITIENQYVQVIINHVVLMCYQERLAAQLQDPTAHTSTIQQMSEAVKAAEINYLDHLKRAQDDVSNSQRVSGWKVDKHDRIY